jgi:hypothetical protein
MVFLRHFNLWNQVLPSLGVRRPSVVRPLTFHILIYSSETTGPNGVLFLVTVAMFVGRMELYEEVL